MRKSRCFASRAAVGTWRRSSRPGFPQCGSPRCANCAAARCADLYAQRMGLVPYIMPGFLLAKKAAEIFEADPAVGGLVLLKHGIFTFGDTAQEAYERMIAAVSQAEERLARRRT